MGNRNRLGVQRTGKLEHRFLEIRSAFLKKTQENLDNNTENQTMGVVGAPREIGRDVRNLGLRLGDETVKVEPGQSMYAPSLAPVKGNVSESSAARKANFGNIKCTPIKICMIGMW